MNENLIKLNVWQRWVLYDFVGSGRLEDENSLKSKEKRLTTDRQKMTNKRFKHMKKYH